MSFWRSNTDEATKMGKGWFFCDLLNPSYKLGYKLPEAFKEKNSEFAVSIDSCHKGDLEREWGKDPISGASYYTNKSNSKDI